MEIKTQNNERLKEFIATYSNELLEDDSFQAEEDDISYKHLLENHLAEQRLIKKKLDHVFTTLETIKKCVIFFTVIAAIGIVSSVIISLL
mgnify:FL=1